MPKWFMGVDPGVKGAISLFDPTDVSTLKVWDMPRAIEIVGKAKRKRAVVDEAGLATLIDDIAEMYLGEGISAQIEQMTAMPDQSSMSGMSLGVSWGQVRMAMTYAGIEYARVRPQQWKGVMGVSANKDTALLACLDLFPDREPLWFGPMGALLDGRCEAALLAMYGSKL